MEEKKNGKSLGDFKKEIKDLEERIALMDADNSALAADLKHWQKVAAGLKGNNRQLAKQVEHYKALGKEGDELNEKRIAMLEEKELVIKGLQEQVNKLAKIKARLVKDVEETKFELDCLRNRKPWYKRIF